MAGSSQRLDKWLFFARVVKSRTLAARLVESGYVRVNGQRATSSSKSIGVGDVLTIALDRSMRILRVVDLGERRGPFREACLLFEELGETQTASARVAASSAGPLATPGISE